MKIKVCGVRDMNMLQVCNASGVDYVGLNFVPRSRRKISADFLDALAYEKKHALYVGVFEDQDLGYVQKCAAKYGLDFVQLHGKESLEYIEQINVPVIKGIALRNTLSLEFLKGYLGKVAVILLDGGNPGAGEQADRTLLLRAIDICREENQAYAVAGGIRPENIEAFASFAGDAAFLDTASGVEDEHGLFLPQSISRLKGAILSHNVVS